MFGAIAGGIASARAGGAMSKLFGGGQKAGSGGIQGDELATDNNTVGMGGAGIKSEIQGSNVPNPDEAVPSFVSGAMAKAGKGLLEGTLQAGTSAVSDKLLDLVGLGGKSAADKGKDTRDYLAAAFPEFFSRRSRHTSCSRDWSSDVCSSDLRRCFPKVYRMRRSAVCIVALALTIRSGSAADRSPASFLPSLV